MPPVMSADTNSVSAPIWKPKLAPNTAPQRMISRKTGVAPRKLGTSRNAASSDTSAPSRATLRAAVESDPGNAAAYDQLGTTLVQMGKLPGAAETYRALVHARPSPAAHRELANVLDRLGQTEEAQRERGTAEALERADVGRPMP